MGKCVEGPVYSESSVSASHLSKSVKTNKMEFLAGAQGGLHWSLHSRAQGWGGAWGGSHCTAGQVPLLLCVPGLSPGWGSSIQQDQD